MENSGNKIIVQKIVFLLIGIFFLVAPLQAETVKIFANESMPFQGIENGKPVGISIDLLEEITRNGGPAFEYEVGLPIQRALIMLSEAKDEPIAFISLTRSPQREKSYQWIAKLFTHTVKVATYKKPAPKTIEEAKHLITGMIRGHGNMPLIKELDFTKIQLVNEAKQNIHKLKLNRIDTIIDTDLNTLYNWQKAGFDLKDLHLGVPITDAMFTYIVGNPRFPKKIAKTISVAMDRMIKNGRYKAIMKKWAVSDGLANH